MVSTDIWGMYLELLIAPKLFPTFYVFSLATKQNILGSAATARDYTLSYPYYSILFLEIRYLFSEEFAFINPAHHLISVEQWSEELCQVTALKEQNQENSWDRRKSKFDKLRKYLTGKLTLQPVLEYSLPWKKKSPYFIAKYHTHYRISLWPVWVRCPHRALPISAHPQPTQGEWKAD